jgi:DNA-binding transcriptional ArsR family regulator
MTVRATGPGECGGLEPLLADPARLFVVSLLSTTEWCRFGFVRDTIALTSSALSRHLAKLREAGYAEMMMGIHGRTWVRLTPRGQERFACHVAALHTIMTRASELVAQARREASVSGDDPVAYWSAPEASKSAEV